MSGHSKWSTIKRHKGALDAKRGALFAKLVKEIIAAAKQGGGSVDGNTRLRTAIQNAKSANVPKENIERAIKKAEGKDAANYLNLTYEGYGPNGVAIIVECITDNLNRTVSSVRAVFNRHNGNLGKNGELAFLFNRVGLIDIDTDDISDIETFTLDMIDTGILSIENENGVCSITCELRNYSKIQKKLEELNLEPISSELVYLPNSLVELDVENEIGILKMITVLEEDDDVQKVFHNMKIKTE